MPSFIDLFAGCGGLSNGLIAAGWTSAAKVEIDHWACLSLRKNFPDSTIIESDIRDISDEDILAIGPVDVIVGGPPCQGFSVAGATQFGVEDPRNALFHWFLHWVRLLQPGAAIIENVPAILSRKQNGRSVLDAITDALGGLGYRVQATILNAADFGVPQARRRAFVVMTRGSRPFAFPRPTHGPASDRKDLFAPTDRHVTVGEALSDLPAINAGEGSDDPAPYATAPATGYQRRCRGEQQTVANHIAMKHTPRLVERFKVIAPGQSLKDVPRTHGQIANHTGRIAEKPFKYNNYRLDPAKPALAIPAAFQSLFLHPTLHRNLTAREAARLMGFPDSFVFCGKRTTMSWEKHLSQYNQIGNAVCPPVATALAEAVERHLRADPADTAPVAAAAVTILRHAHGRTPVPIAPLAKPLSTEIVRELDIAARLLGEDADHLRIGGVELTLAALPLALILADADRCPMCSSDRPPHGRHGGEFCFLISKDTNDSLIDNEQDHGLDYHLRFALGIEHQIGHVVGERLAALGHVALTSIQNPRTGRRVRGMRTLRSDIVPRHIARLVLDALAHNVFADDMTGLIACG